MSEVASVYATFADAEEAARIARTVVEERLAACANILGPCRSIYRWQGRIEEADEVAVIFKTSAETAPRLAARIAELHSYEVPAVFVWDATAGEALDDWVRDSTG